MEHSRRVFLKRASVGAAAAGAAVAVPGIIGSAGADAAPEEPAGPAHAGSFVAWVKDPASGQIAVLVGEKELVFTDRTMARRLAKVAAKALKA